MDTPNSLSAIEELIDDYKFLLDKVFPEEPSIAQHIQRHLKKMFILCCASYYETQITLALKSYSQSHAKKYKAKPHGFGYLEIFSFFKMFDFGRDRLKEANAFLTPLVYLGREFKGAVLNEVSTNEALESSMKAFQEMCSLRNSLVHNDLISTNDAIEAKTFENVEVLHTSALKFVEFMVDILSV